LVKPLYEAIKGGRAGTHGMGRETTKRLLKKIKRHSQTLLLWACQM
jgi:hypothetical protein